MITRVFEILVKYSVYRRRLVTFSVAVTCMAYGFTTNAEGFWNGLQLMEEVYRRHEQFPYVYEEHSMVMVDRDGKKDSRQSRLYSRVEENGEVKFLYTFESPREVKGVTLLAVRQASGEIKSSIYLPAFGEEFIDSTGEGSDGNFLGTDFSVEALTVEDFDRYSYVRNEDETISEVDYFVIDVYPAGEGSAEKPPKRRHYIRKDCFYITRTDHFDDSGRLHKQQSHYDLKQLQGNMWRAGIILMDDRKLGHKSVIKVNRRIFSRDYVPAEMFTTEWILANYPSTSGQEPEEENEIYDDEVTDDETITTVLSDAERTGP